MLSEEAAAQTLALNPLVGVSKEELLSAATSTMYQGVRQPLSLLKATAGYSRKLLEIAFDKRAYAVAPKDRRFNDPSWKNSWVHRGLLQSYLAFVESLDEWVDETGFDELDKQRARFVTRIIGDSLSPTNVLASNPSALKQVVETGGASVLNGLRNLLHDRRHNNGMPSQVDKAAFTLGENLATTKGSVVFRNETLELIQYAPMTEKVYRRPLLFIPPQVNKFYFYDLSPEKSFFQYCIGEGLQVFTVSWRNPGPEHADWGIDHYVSALKEAIEVVQGISASKSINVTAPCSGGITATILAGHYKARGEDVINAMTLPVTVLQQKDGDSDLTLFVNERAIEASRSSSRRNGVLRGKDLAKIFAWMRPNDLIWNYVVNNYLLGNTPPIFDVLYWNNDPTNLPAQLHSDFLDIIGNDALVRPGDLSVCDTDIDLTAVDNDLFLVGGLTDHLTPWQACYRTTHLMGGDKEFLLVASGHIQSLVSSPNNPKSRYYQNSETPTTAKKWLASATEVQGTWWPHWSEWIRARSGAQKKAPAKVGSKIHSPLCDAPGSYVLDPTT
jgi:polyhydroxyalkanoate synthase